VLDIQQCCLVVGASGDLGLEIATKLAERNFDLSLTYSTERSRSKLQACLSPDSKVAWYKMDVTDPASIKSVADKVRRESKLQNLVYCAGLLADSPIAFMSDTQWQKVIDVNLTGPFNVVREISRDLMALGDAKIIILGSVSAKLGTPGQANYAASKAGLEGFVRVAAAEFGRFGVNVNLVAPGAIESRMMSGIHSKLVQQAMKNAPLRRLGLSSEVAELVVSLLGPAGAFVTGQTISVDGGLAMGR
jgi:3-oxoacyl-[acyl-carrier protein] reductase